MESIIVSHILVTKVTMKFFQIFTQIITVDGKVSKVGMNQIESFLLPILIVKPISISSFKVK